MSCGKGCVKVPQTGKQYTITSGSWSAVIIEQAAAIASLKHNGIDVLHTIDTDKPLLHCDNSVICPFVNRIKGGKYTFNGEEFQLPINEPERNNATHGFSILYKWSLKSITKDSLTLEWQSPALGYYPFYLVVRVTYKLSECGLKVCVVAENKGETSLPFGLAFHPWLALGGEKTTPDKIQADVDKCRIELNCKTHVLVDENLIPYDKEVASGIYDLSTNPTLQDRAFDDAWIDPERSENGETKVVFTRLDGRKVVITGDKTIKAWQVYTATGEGDSADRPYAVAIEPMTSIANSLQTGEDLITVNPGESYKISIRYSVE